MRSAPEGRELIYWTTASPAKKGAPQLVPTGRGILRNPEAAERAFFLLPRPGYIESRGRNRWALLRQSSTLPGFADAVPLVPELRMVLDALQISCVPAPLTVLTLGHCFAFVKVA